MRALTFSICLMCLGLAYIANALAQPAPHARIAVNSPGSKPFLYFHRPSGTYQGVVIDLLQTAVDRDQLSVSFVDSNRTRLEIAVAQRKADVFFTSRAWLNAPQQLLSSRTVLMHESYVYTASPIQNNQHVFDSPGMTVCTRRGFSYPKLEPLVHSGTLFRMDSSSHQTMLTMLLSQRCDFAIMNNHNASALFTQTGQTAYRSEKAHSVVPMVFVLHEDLAPLVNVIDQAADAFVASGRLKQSIERHSRADD